MHTGRRRRPARGRSSLGKSEKLRDADSDHHHQRREARWGGGDARLSSRFVCCAESATDSCAGDSSKRMARGTFPGAVGTSWTWAHHRVRKGVRRLLLCRRTGERAKAASDVGIADMNRRVSLHALLCLNAMNTLD